MHPANSYFIIFLLSLTFSILLPDIIVHEIQKHTSINLKLGPFEKLYHFTMPFDSTSPTFQTCSFAAKVIEGAPIGMQRGVLDSKTAVTFSTCGMFLDQNGQNICCSSCDFKSSLLYDVHKILGRHFHERKHCPNSVKIRQFGLKRLLPANITDWSFFVGFDPSSLQDQPTIDATRDHNLFADDNSSLLFDYETISPDPVERSKLADFKSVNSDAATIVESDSLDETKERE